ncbi:hypothetical protein N9N14_01635 [Candidatus Poseidonia alphae]|uniref:hypothetical protein n=1 Tax=Candidatus Poseidonia alphae TaxID=1915863 RepID=UPI00230B0806|nr:hypothetical protein [Candidatus Poseidonia alphae]MDA8839168.1 hypothetical protein [Candidatus Poseidonia alphae]
MATKHDVTDLDQGLFKFPLPTWRGLIGYLIALSMFVSAFTMYSSGQSIPDIPQLSEADRLDELGDIDSYNFQSLQDGYEQPHYQSNKAAFVLIPLELEEGIIGTEGCYESEDEDGNVDINYGYELSQRSIVTFRDQAGNSITTSFDRSGTLDPEGDFIQPGCNQAWEDDVRGYGRDSSENRMLMTYMLVQNEPNEYYQLLSFAEIKGFNDEGSPPEITQREDAGRFALLASGIGGLIFMYSTPSPLSYDLRRIRKRNQTDAKESASAVGVLGLEGRQFQHCGPNGEVIGPAKQPLRQAFDDWLFGCPPLPASYANVFAQDGDGSLIPEHPQRIGTPRPAMLTPYSLGAITFAVSFIWLSSDLRARDGSDFHTMIGFLMTFFVTIVNILWFFSAYRQAKLSQTINDLPTSPIRSVAVGQAEVVGQVRPSSAGTPAFTVGGEEMQGTVLWTWSSFKYVCRQTDDGQECGWEHRETQNGGVPFVLHDGTGGMIIDPSLWQAKNKTSNLGANIAEWEKGKWKWTVSAIGVGDPLYVLGDCVPRTREHLDAWGGDETEGSALITMVPSSETGEGSIMSLGTELDVVAKRRSRFEMLIVPIIVFIFGIFMFLDYKP